jgi:hypothetical protein
LGLDSPPLNFKLPPPCFAQLFRMGAPNSGEATFNVLRFYVFVDLSQTSLQVCLLSLLVG